MEIMDEGESTNSFISGAIYRNVKVKLNTFMDRIVQRCNCILENEEEFQQSIVKANVLKIVRVIGSLALLLQQLPRAEAFKVCGSDGDVVYFGSQHGADTFQDLYNNCNRIKPQAFGRFKVWKLPSLARKWISTGAKMVVCEFSPLFPFCSNFTFVVSSPELIEQEIALPEDLNDLYNCPAFGKIRQKLKRSKRRAEFSSFFTRDKKDFDLYYYQMYLPYITKRHGNVAAITPYECALQNFNRGGLVMIKEGQKAIAGVLITTKKQTCFALEAGILDGDTGLLCQEVYSFNQWSVLEWAYEQGLKKVNMGAASAWRSNGIFAYKKHWCARVCRFRAVQGNLFYLMENPSEEFLEKMNKKGIITENRGKYYSVIFRYHPIEDENWLEGELRGAVKDGLLGIAIVSPNSKRFYHGDF